MNNTSILLLSSRNHIRIELAKNICVFSVAENCRDLFGVSTYIFFLFETNSTWYSVRECHMLGEEHRLALFLMCNSSGYRNNIELMIAARFMLGELWKTLLSVRVMGESKENSKLFFFFEKNSKLFFHKKEIWFIQFSASFSYKANDKAKELKKKGLGISKWSNFQYLQESLLKGCQRRWEVKLLMSFLFITRPRKCNHPKTKMKNDEIKNDEKTHSPREKGE